MTVEGSADERAGGDAGDVSSQYITALMLIGPYLPGGLRAVVDEPPLGVGALRGDDTQVMANFGVTDVRSSAGGRRGPAGRIPADAVRDRARRLVGELPAGDRAVVGGTSRQWTRPALGAGRRPLRRACWARWVLGRTAAGARWSVGAATTQLRGIDVDMADISDLVPTLAAVALYADTPTRITGVGFIRGKESDRLGDLARRTAQASAGTSTRPTTDCSFARRPCAALGLSSTHTTITAWQWRSRVIGCAVPGIEVVDPDVVSKSWPGFWDMLDELAS